MLSNPFEVDIADIVETSEYSSIPFCLEISSNRLIKICVGESKYILKLYTNNDCFEKELGFMYLLLKNKCKVPSLIKYSSSHCPQSWILYEYVEGVSLSIIKKQLSAKELRNVWKQVGQELRKIHSTSIDGTKIENNKSKFISQLKRIVDFFNNNSKNIDSLILTDAILFLKNNFSRIEKSVYGIILYDLNDKHIIISKKNKKWNLNAFIDFEQTHFGCIYVDVVWLYINDLLEDKESEKSFWIGYDPERLIFDNYCICFFLMYFGLELCTVLRKVNACNYQWGLSIVETALDMAHNIELK